MGKAFDIEPKDVKRVATPFRTIVTKIPAPETLEILETLRRCEPISMTGQPPIVWDRAEGVQVFDRAGNKWLDWSSGVVVANAGHGAREVKEAIRRQLDKGLLHNYCFPNAERAELVQYLVDIAPKKLNKVFLLTTGSEATECAMKLARTYGQRVGGREKRVIVSFGGAFHGRTLGAQQIGGIPALKEWIVNLDPDMRQVPFPDAFRTKDTSFDLFLKTLAQNGIATGRVAGVIMETFQGGSACFAPKEYVRALARWCSDHQALLVCDEIQAGFGRTGRLFGFEHYDIVPDLICCGKGISSSLPLSAVLGRSDVMDLYGPAEMTSTHTGNPVCAVAALASIRKIVEEGLVKNAQAMGEMLLEGLRDIARRFPGIIGMVRGRGLVAGMHVVRTGTRAPDGDLAFAVVEKAFQKGLLLFAPVGFGGATLKVCPPLTITREAIADGLSALRESVTEAAVELGRP
ncbi:MAG: 4-aminobutyrate aminotransferase [candidate division NC10 bacterium RBG_16_65_8]|nr:MAG: 4-aminobutyrate aminotransferase [candidate division NC10 bacterium RBG_16_65_8]